MRLTLSHQASHSDDVLFQEVGGEAVLLKLASENYFGLDPIGTRIWSLLGDGNTLQHAYDVLIDEYDVEPEILERDLLALVERMASAGLVIVR
ncbi:MAG TPA: PqqD family protein [Steroidobacteraceae bacterium]